MGILERIKDIEDELARTQRNKATEHHTGLLKGRLARLRSQLLEESTKKAGGGGERGFEARKAGDARVALVGFPSVGKSTLLNKITKTRSEVASYEYTTLTCVPGVLEINGSRIQILDLPGIIEEAARGRGRGRQVIAVARTADLILLMMDASRGAIHKRLLLREMHNAGIRCNIDPPNMSFNIKTSGNIGLTSTVQQTKGVSERLVRELMRQRSLVDFSFALISISVPVEIHHADIVLREDITIDQLLDGIEGNRRYVKCLYVYNKIDTVTIEEIDRLAREPHTIVTSLEMDLNIENLKAALWRELDLIRVYSKKKGRAPDFVQPFVLRRGATVKTVCQQIHADLYRQFKYGVVWGRSVKHENGQTVGLSHELADEDVITIIHRN